MKREVVRFSTTRSRLLGSKFSDGGWRGRGKIDAASRRRE
jgi:hypothetical protein